MKQRKRIKKTKVSNEDAPLSNKEFLAWVDRVLAKPLNPKGVISNKKQDWIKAEHFNKS
jgi:hypothetical protein